MEHFWAQSGHFSGLAHYSLIFCMNLKLVCAIFSQIFVFNQMIAYQKIWKMFFISSKKLFWLSRYSNFCISVFSSFSPCQPLLRSHCLGGWFKINLKVCDAINCLNKNLITPFAWCLGKEKRYGIETLSIDRVLKKNNFWKNHTEKVHPKLVPDPFLLSVNISKQPLHARNYFKNKIIWKRIIKNP